MWASNVCGCSLSASRCPSLESQKHYFWYVLLTTIVFLYPFYYIKEFLPWVVGVFVNVTD